MTADARAPSHLAYRPDIDGLRGLAVLLVLVFHFNLAVSGKAGFMGVDVFFVISGYLITSIIQRELDAGHFSFARFYANRVRRLAPPLFAVLVLTGLAGSWLLFPRQFLDLSTQLLVAQFYVANVYFWKQINYFGLSADSVALLHTWSLCVEEQFYLIYPLALAAIHRWRRNWLWPSIAALMLGSFLLNIALFTGKPQFSFYMLPTRAWELCAGAAVVWVEGRWKRSLWVDQIAGALGLAMIALAVGIYDKSMGFPGFIALLPVLGAALLILVGATPGVWTRRVFSTRPIVFIGKISYSLYLVHWPIHVFAAEVFKDDYGYALRLAMFAASLLLATALYHAVEQPFRKRRVWQTNRSLWAGYGVGLVATAAAFFMIKASGGLPQRFEPEVARLASYANDRPPASSLACEFQGGALDAAEAFGRPACQIGQPGGKVSWLIFGDSHAWAAQGAYDLWLKSRGETALLRYRNSCLPARGGVHLYGDALCHDFNAAALEYLKANPQIGRVIVASSWMQAPEGRLTANPTQQADKATSLRLFQEGFDSLLAELNGLQRKVYIWEPVASAKGPVPEGLARAAQGHEKTDLSFSKQEYDSRFAFFYDALNRNASLLSGRIPVASALCNTGRCEVESAGAPVYFDVDHIVHSSAPRWAAVIAQGIGASP